jgi:hypothetical protein
MEEVIETFSTWLINISLFDVQHNK